jgi:hypothetical protein
MTLDHYVVPKRPWIYAQRRPVTSQKTFHITLESHVLPWVYKLCVRILVFVFEQLQTGSGRRRIEWTEGRQRHNRNLCAGTEEFSQDVPCKTCFLPVQTANTTIYNQIGITMRYEDVLLYLLLYPEDGQCAGSSKQPNLTASHSRRQYSHRSP